MSIAELTVCAAKPSDFAAVRALIVAGLTQRWQRYEPSFNPDLESFEASYGSAYVLIAKHGERIVGCGILKRQTQHVAEIVRMSVASEFQRQGIGSKLLQALLERAKRDGYQEIVLETTADWTSAVAFYKRHGFVATVRRDGDQYFRLAPPGN